MAKTLEERAGFDQEYVEATISGLKNMSLEDHLKANEAYQKMFPEHVKGQYAEVAMNREAIGLTCAALLETLLYQDKVHTLDDTMILTAIGTMITTLTASCQNLSTLAAMHAILGTLKEHTESHTTLVLIQKLIKRG